MWFPESEGSPLKWDTHTHTHTHANTHLCFEASSFLPCKFNSHTAPKRASTNGSWGSKFHLGSPGMARSKQACGASARLPHDLSHRLDEHRDGLDGGYPRQRPAGGGEEGGRGKGAGGDHLRRRFRKTSPLGLPEFQQVNSSECSTVYAAVSLERFCKGGRRSG